MRKTVVTAVVALSIGSLAPVAVVAGKKTVPAQISRARYVALGFDLGDRRFVSALEAIGHPEVLPEEHRALEAIDEDIRRWGRYVVTTRPQDAELLLAVRIGRRATLGGGIAVGGPMEGSGGLRRGNSYGGSISSNEDMLTIYESAFGGIGAELWRLRKGGGLAGEPPLLYREFRVAVEQTPEPSKKPEKKPE